MGDKDKSQVYCKTIATSISDIIRFSLDEEFRSKTLKIFNSQSTKETEEKIYNKLMEIIENGEEVNSNNAEVEDEDLEKQEKDSDSTSNITSQDTSTPSTSTQDNDSPSLFSPRNFHKKNWFKISNEKYKESLKIRKQKIQYFSQPSTSNFCYENPKHLRSSTQIPSYYQTQWDFLSTSSLSQNIQEDSDENETVCYGKRLRKF